MVLWYLLPTWVTTRNLRKYMCYLTQVSCIWYLPICMTDTCSLVMVHVNSERGEDEEDKTGAEENED